MSRHQTTWIVVADARSARLIHCIREGEHFRIESLDEFHEQWDDKEHHRPQPLHDKTGHAYASTHHEAEERLRRFAKSLMNWIDKQHHRLADGRWALIAPPRLLGEMRKLDSKLLGGFKQVQAELEELTAAKIARHPALSQACQ